MSLVAAFIVRVALVLYGVVHDSIYEVGYTDIDYKVFTDAARHVVNGSSPYKRHTYRYSPLIALVLTPNVLLHPLWGKCFFCTIDLVVGLLIKRLVYINVRKFKVKLKKARVWSKMSMLFWLFNPLTIAISTRGNSDSLSCLLVILTLYFIQTNKYPFVVGLMHGISIHVRLYPIIYSLLFYLHYSRTRNFIPNLPQLMLVLGCMTSLTLLTAIFYTLYGYEFIYETYIYHFIRRDFKHNFSLYFYLQYLTAFLKPSFMMHFWQRVFMNLPPIVLLLNLNKFSLNFGVLLQTMVFVVYNKVLTSQYFVWIMGVLPLCLWQIRMTKYEVAALLAIWGLAQCGWLLPAYMLEFQGEDTFVYVWIQSVSLFCVHIGVLGRLIKGYVVPGGNKLHKLE